MFWLTRYRTWHAPQEVCARAQLDVIRSMGGLFSVGLQPVEPDTTPAVCVCARVWCVSVRGVRVPVVRTQIVKAHGLWILKSLLHSHFQNGRPHIVKAHGHCTHTHAHPHTDQTQNPHTHHTQNPHKPNTQFKHTNTQSSQNTSYHEISCALRCHAKNHSNLCRILQYCQKWVLTRDSLKYPLCSLGRLLAQVRHAKTNV